MPENIYHIAAIVRRKAMSVCCDVGFSFYLYNSESPVPAWVSLSIYTALDLLLLCGVSLSIYTTLDLLLLQGFLFLFI